VLAYEFLSLIGFGVTFPVQNTEFVLFTQYKMLTMFIVKPIFSDETTYMLLSEGSLADLNSRSTALGKSYSTRQFRPTIVMNGCGPYEEVVFH
jgi:uncharacterized protein YcbX